MIRSHPGFSYNWRGLVKTFLLEKFFSTRKKIHVTWCWDREDWNQCSKWRMGQAKCAGETLDFNHLKRPQKASFWYFFMERYYCIRIHWRRYVISPDDRAESNFHSRRGRRVVVNNLSWLYFERSKRAYYVRKFFSFRMRNVYPEP